MTDTLSEPEFARASHEAASLDEQTSHSRSPAPPAAPPRRKQLGLPLLLAAVLAGGIWGARFIYERFTHEKTENAYVQGNIHTISSRVTGVVREVLVQENSEVVAGQPLVKLDTRDFEMARDQARAALAQANAQLAQASAQLADAEAQTRLTDAQVTQAAAQVAREEADAAKTKSDLARAVSLADQGEGRLISRSDLDAAKAIDRGALAGADGARASLTGARAGADSMKAKLQAGQAARDAALAQQSVVESKLKDAELQLSYTILTAPVSGRVNRRNIEVGDHLQAGQALFALVEPQAWIEANFKETQLARIRLGQPVDITVDALPGHSFRGSIESFAPATGAQFALLPPDNASGNFTKVVQRVPVKIRFAPDSITTMQNRLWPGLSTIVNVDIR